MAMTINQITIENFGGIAHLDISLDEHIHMIETSYVEEMIVILTRLLSVEPQLPVSVSWIRDGIRRSRQWSKRRLCQYTIRHLDGLD